MTDDNKITLGGTHKRDNFSNKIRSKKVLHRFEASPIDGVKDYVRKTDYQQNAQDSIPGKAKITT